VNELFGIPVSILTVCVVFLLAGALLTTAALAMVDRTSFRIGARNILRRPVQTTLVVVGLTLATLIVTAALATGDTIDHSLTKGAYDLLRRSDIDITWTGERDFSDDAGAARDGTPSYVADSAVATLETAFAGDSDIAGFLPALYASMAATNTTSDRSTPAVQVAGFDPARLSRLGGLRLVNGDPADLLSLPLDQVYLSERAARDLDAAAGDQLVLHGPAGLSTFTVAGIVRDELASGVLGLQYTSVPGGVAMPLTAARDLLGLGNREISALTVVLDGDVRSTAGRGSEPTQRLRGYIGAHSSELFGPVAGQVEVFPVKDDLVRNGEQAGTVFTSIFLVLGLFSMAAGVLLIFMIFVMLASERRGEMGVARAIGAPRRHLVRSFVAEGMVYSVLAGMIGAPLGVLASLGLTSVLLPVTGGEYFSIVEAHITWRSVVIGYGVGVVITFATSILASLRVTHVNIVAAIRNLPEGPRPAAPRHVRTGWVVAGIAAMALPPLGIWWTFRKGLGLSWTWILAPTGVAAGIALILLGKSSGILFPFALGISLVPVSMAAVAIRSGAPRRALWTAVGGALLAYWLLPPAQHDALFGAFTSDIEMFVLAGIMIVVGATLVIVFNLSLLVRLLTRPGEQSRSKAPLLLAGATIASVAGGIAFGDAGGGTGQLGFLLAGVLAPVAFLTWAAARLPRLAPALKMAIAYPLANRFRTGMTIAMFSLTVFSLTVFSVLLANFSVLDGGDAARGNLDLVATLGTTSGGGSVTEMLHDAASPEADAIAAEGRTTIGTGAQEVRLANGSAWDRYPVIAADARFLATLSPALEWRAVGFDSDQAVLDAVSGSSRLALIDRYAAGQGFSTFAFDASVEATDGYFEPFTVEIRDSATGAVTTVTVVGVLRAGLVSSTIAGIYVNETTYEEVFGPPFYLRSYLRVAANPDAREVALDIESALATRGVQVDSIAKLLADQNAQITAFNRMFQAFMALGLLVGIAGLGVIAFRSVVERRQQIGMLRAIGYQRGAISLTFLLESTFVAVLGILSGVVGGALLARNLLTSESFTEGGTVALHMPWTEVTVVAFASLGFSLAMGWLPARGASRVPVAEALRYE
jgi:putative ABC transport system permease protein